MNKKELKNKGGITLVALVITIIILIILATVTINVLSGDNGLVKQAQLAKDLSSNTTESEFNGMNSLFDEYVNMMSEDANINQGDCEMLDNFRKQVAEAITKAGVETSETDSVNIMIENIGKILVENTKDATATADNISEGKTAYINGEKITGNGKDVQDAYDNGYNEASKESFQRVKIASNVGNGTYSVTSIENYKELTVENFFFVITSTDIYSIASREGYAFQNKESNTTPVVSYEASTGTITLSGCSTSGSNYQGSGHTNLKGDLYCVYAK